VPLGADPVACSNGCSATEGWAVSQLDLDAQRLGVGTLQPFASRLALSWLRDDPAVRYRTMPGTMVFADISGFTRLTERLAAKGRFGAEEMSEHLDLVLSALLTEASAYGGWLVKWGGDALLLMFDDSSGAPDAARACAAADAMRSVMADVGRLDTSVGRVRLRMSVGVHSGTFEFLLLGQRHRELLVTGEAATTTATLEATAEAGEIVVSPATAGRLPAQCRGQAKGDGLLLAAPPAAVGASAPVARFSDDEVRLLIPDLVAEHLVAGGGSGEHRQVAVAFVEFRGVVELQRVRGPAGVVEALEHLVDVTQQACHRFRVSFHETDIGPDGGKFMLVSGAPLALADPCEALLCVARDVVDNPGALSVRVGVTTGRVFTGAVGPAYRRSYSVKGDVVNLAARIMGKSQAGQIWATPEVVSRSRTQFAATELAPFAVKGKKAPVTAYAVGPPVSRVGADTEIPMTGRIAELVTMWAAALQAEKHTGSVVEILGDPGSGKSRLIAETRHLATGFAFIAVGAEPYRAATPYAAIRPILQQALGLGTGDAETLRARLAAWSAAVAPQLTPWLPLLGVVLDIDLPDTTETREIDAQFRPARIETTIRDALTAALPAPTVIAIDDAQFADEASAGVLRHLAEHIGDRPWLLVVARRLGDADQAAVSDAAVAIELDPLPEDEARALVLADTDDAPLNAHVVDAILERADGNPMFLRELAKAARRVGDVDSLPDSVENVLAAQVGALPPARRDLLRAASVIGMSIDPVLLAEMLASDQRSLIEQLQQLRDFLGPDGRDLRFRQALIHDAAYEGLPYRQRARLHSQLADVLAERSADDGAAPAVLSFHYLQAGRFAEALKAARAAAERAAAAYANVEAETLFARAVAAARKVRGTAAADIASLLENLADVRVRLGAFDRADATYAAVRRLSGADPVVIGRIGMKTARSASQQGKYALALARLSRAERQLAQIPGDDAERLRIDLAVRAADTQFRQGKLAAARATCLDLLSRAHDRRAPDAVAEALGLLDLAELGLGQRGDRGRAERALALYEELGGLLGQARVLNQIGYRAYFDGRWTEAVQLYAQSRDLLARSGDRPNVAVTEVNIAEILIDQGRVTEAEERLRSALQIWRASGARSDAAFAHCLLGRVLARQGDYDAGRAMLAEARAEFLAQGARTDVVEADTYLAECRLAEGRHGEALALASTTLTAARALSELPVQAPLLHRIIGACLDAAGQHAEAAEAYATGLAVARKREAAHEIAFTLTAIAARSRLTGIAAAPDGVAEAREIRSQLGLVVDVRDRSVSAQDEGRRSPRG
jgi:class 3 adenylate cyclase/tetratricopeptide (TPR) repeat protein